MATFRGLARKSSLIRGTQRLPAFAYALDVNDDNRKRLSSGGASRPELGATPPKCSGTLLNRHHTPLTILFGPCFPRYMSSSVVKNLDINLHDSSGAVTEGLDVTGVLKDGADVFADVAVQAASAQTPPVNEIAIAAADSAFPVAALQYIIDNVHCFTGFNWWSSIALTTVLIRGATIPLLLNQLKATQKLSILRPRLEEIRANIQQLPMTEAKAEMDKLFKEHGVTPFSPLKGLLIQGPIFVSFFFAISNMAEKVASMKTGGTSWFVDLTTPDNLYIFPVLTAVTFWLTVELNSQEGMEGNPHASTMKNISRIFAAASVPFTMHFPKAIFCYWITSNLFSLTYGLVLKAPGVKKFLGIPDLPAPQPTTTPPPSFNLYETLQLARSNMKEKTPNVQKKSSDQRVSSVLNQRIRSLEKQVKGKKRNKNR